MRKLVIYAEGFVVVNLLWITAFWIAKSKVIPSPIDVYLSFSTVVVEKIHVHILVSLLRIFLGIAISVLIGGSIGYLMAISDRWGAILIPVVYFTYPIPKMALLPIVMIFFGLGDASKIILICLIIVFQIIISVRDSILETEQECINYVMSMGATQFQLVRYVILPRITPAVISSVRITIGTALSILFFCEGYGTTWGLGYYILDSWSRIDYIAMYKGIIIISFIGICSFISLDILENRVVKWKVKI